MNTVYVVTILRQTKDGAEIIISPAFSTKAQAFEAHYRMSNNYKQERPFSVEIHELEVIPPEDQ